MTRASPATRRSLLARLGVAGSAALAGCQTLLPGSSADGGPACRTAGAPWPMAGRTPDRGGVAASDAPADPTVERLAAHDGDLPPSAPVVGPDRVFVASRTRLVSIERDGGVAWNRAPPDPGAGFRPAATPALGCGATFAALREGVAAFERSDGSLRWRRTPGADGAGPLAYADGTVYLPRDDGLLAFDARTGDRRWRAASAGGPALAVDPGAGEDRARAYVGGADEAGSGGVVTAVEPGGVVWEAGVARHVRLALGRARDDAGDVDRVYACGEDDLVALDAATGDVIWRREGPRGFGGGLAIDGDRGRVYRTAGGGRRAAAVDVDGGTAWETGTGGSANGGGAAAPVVAGDAVLFPGEAGLTAVDVDGGTRRWRVEATGGVPSRSVAVVDGVAYASGFDGVYAVR